VRKRLEGKEIEEVKEVKEFGGRLLVGQGTAGGVGERRLGREFTAHGRTDCRSCEYIKWVLVI
jgi:hypothetical protein